MKRTIFLKIFTGYFIVTCLLAGSIFFFSFRISRHYQVATLTADLEKLGKMLRIQINPLLQKGDVAALDRLVKALGREIETRITVVDARGNVLADSKRDPAGMENHGTRTEVIQALHGKTTSSLRYSTTVKADMLYVALPLLRGQTVGGAVRVSLFLHDINLILQDLRASITQIALSIICAALLGSYFAARKLSNPIRELGQASRRVASGDFNTRVFLQSSDELGDLAGSFNDMTEKIRDLFEQVSVHEEELKNIIAAMREGLLVINRAGRITITNDSFTEILQAPISEGSFYREALREPGLCGIIETAASEKKNSVEEIELRGRSCLCSTSFVAANADTVVVLFDLSEIRNVERMKKDFVVNVSHELRTPLTAIKGFVETMNEEVSDASHRRYLEIVQRHTDRLINIVKDLMALSKLEKDQRLELEEVDIAGLFGQVKTIFDPVIKAKGLTLKVEKETAPAIKADPFKLEQVFINLIDNAVKYTEEGEIRIFLSGDDRQAVIRVEDSGIGMVQEQLARIFERFYVVDKSRSRSVGGTGLGLAIVKHIVLLHSGTIDVESTFGEGTRFIVKIPRSIS